MLPYNDTSFMYSTNHCVNLATTFFRLYPGQLIWYFHQFSFYIYHTCENLDVMLFINLVGNLSVSLRFFWRFSKKYIKETKRREPKSCSFIGHLSFLKKRPFQKLATHEKRQMRSHSSSRLTFFKTKKGNKKDTVQILLIHQWAFFSSKITI